MFRNIKTTVRNGCIATAVTLQTDLGCEAPESIEPLFALVDSSTSQAFLAEGRLGVLRFSATPLVMMLSGQDTTQAETSCGTMPEQFQQLAELLTRIQQLGVALALLIAAIMLIYGGILWMRGTPDSQQKARKIIFNTLVGLVIVLMAGGLVEFVKSVLCGGGG